jgi:2-polyprenyl-3-methyl-5-hydroxy-6-metoxy-1,4-benzoquinol methylase
MGEDSHVIVDRVVADVGGAFSTGLAYIGDRLGLFRCLADHAPSGSRELAARLRLNERYVREWLKAMVSSGYVEADGGQYFMTESQKAVLADEDSPLFAAGAFQFALPSLGLTSRLIECFRNGGGVPYRELGSEIPEAIDRMHRPWFEHYLTQRWLPSVPCLTARLDDGVRVLDVGCGLGRSTLAVARAWPRSLVTGIDPDAASIRQARKLARESGLDVTFVDGRLCELEEGSRFDLVVAIDCVHDMADPVAELAEVRRLLAKGGTVFWSEPTGSPNPMENRGPVEKMRACLSPYHCLTVSLAEDGEALGTIIGEAGARELAEEAGFSVFESVPIESRMQQFFVLRK